MSRPNASHLIAGAALATLLLVSSPAAAQISLGTAETFAVLAGSTVTNTGLSVITGDVGVSPGTAITGFPPGVVVPPGMIHSADAVAAQAQADLTAAYNAIVATPTLVDLTGTDLGGLTLPPSVYGFDTSAQLTGTLTLDAQGNPDAVFLFKIGSTLTTATSSSVVVINGGSNCRVFWQVGSSATLGTTTAFVGNVLALTSITLNTGASTSGRALARNGAVTLDGNEVTVCPGPGICPVIVVSPPTLPNGEVGTVYSETITASGSTALPYTFAVSSGALPTGLNLDPLTGEITGTPTVFGTFNFTITATDTDGCFGSQAYTVVIAAQGCPIITLSPLALPSGLVGIPYNETVSASGGTPPYTFAITSGALPTGLLLDPATGTISGTPTTPGLFSFTITATDSLGCPGSLAYTIVIGIPVNVLAIPALSAWGLMALAALIGLAAIQFLRRAA